MSKKNTAINYTSRDFESIRRDLEDFAKRYYPNTYKDFNRASFGSLMLDTVSYVGDILSFYLDYQMNETFLDSAVAVTDRINEWDILTRNQYFHFYIYYSSSEIPGSESQ